MARSTLRSDQVLDEDFISHTEHSDPSEVSHSFLMNVDTPTTYSGHAGQYVKVSGDSSKLEFSTVTATSEFPRYYIEQDLTITVNDYGQYVIHDLNYIEVAGTLELGAGSMLIIS